MKNNQGANVAFYKSNKFLLLMVAAIFVVGAMVLQLIESKKNQPKELMTLCFDKFQIYPNCNYSICLCRSLDQYRYKLFVTLKSGRIFEEGNKTFFDVGAKKDKDLFCYQSNARGGKIHADWERQEWEDSVVTTNIKNVSILVWEAGSSTEELNPDLAIYAAHIDF